ncbi:MAG: dihydrolipoyl dehydrogenase [Gammaproteobacteria bacterium]|nr:MAG: dihydrolipoyl dehydrogenase [Gammaproteobacteria bacterium]
MSKDIVIPVPDIGDFQDVDIIEVLITPGDQVEEETSLITLETDKATMDIPSPQAGTVNKILVKVGDKVSQGDPILTIVAAETDSGKDAAQQSTMSPDNNLTENQSESTAAAEKPVSDVTAAENNADIHAEVVVLGSGPGGYTAAFRSADLGKKTVLIERHKRLGGVCLNVGCIPSKALLHTAQIINEAAEFSAHGVTFGKPEIDIRMLADWKNKVTGRLTGGLAQLAKQRKVKVITGNGTIQSPHLISVETADGEQLIRFDHLIIAAGSQASKIPGFPYDDERLMDSTGALELSDIPERLLVIGGGIIGLEMATVYDALGSNVTIVELGDGLIPGCDRDLVRPLEKRLKKRYENIYLKTSVTAIEAKKKGLKVFFEGDKSPVSDTFDRVLVAVGRTPNGHLIGAENAGININERGFIPADNQQRTNIEHIFAIGDIVGQPMLAHKATHEGKVAAEVIAGMKSFFDARTIPSVAYTDPEVAWMGMTETQAKADGIKYEKGAFPWAASGRSLSLGRDEGITKVLFDKDSGRIIGAGIVGPNAGELIAETVLALEMGADAQDIGLTIHPHPTLSETINFAAEVAEGTITDLYIHKRK